MEKLFAVKERCRLLPCPRFKFLCSDLGGTVGPGTRCHGVTHSVPSALSISCSVKINSQMKFPLEQVSVTLKPCLCPRSFFFYLPSSVCLFITYLFLRQTLTVYPWPTSLELAMKNRLASSRNPLPASAS